MRGFEVSIQCWDLPNTRDTIEVLAGSHEQAGAEACKRYRKLHPGSTAHELEIVHIDSSQLLTQKLLATQPAQSDAEFMPPDVVDYTFSDWLTSTRRLQEVAYGSYYEKFTDEERADSMMMNLYAIVTETTEMGEECGWKPWAQPRGWINRDSVISEAVDILHFVGNMLTHARCTGAELTAAYRAKQLKNLQRQVDGYDGVTEKCPVCKRALDDPAVLCTTERCAGQATYA